MQRRTRNGGVIGQTPRAEPRDRRPRRTSMRTFASPAGAPPEARVWHEAGVPGPAGFRHKAGVAAVLAAAAALTAACGSQSAAGNGAAQGAAGAKPVSSLTISVAAARGATPIRWSL